MVKDKIKQLEDELKALRKKPNEGATARKKVDVLNELAAILEHSQPLKSETYAKQALNFGKKLDYKKGCAEGYFHLGWSSFIKGNYSRAVRYYSESLRIYEKIGDNEGSAKSYKSIGMIYGEQSSYNKASEYFTKGLAICKNISNRRTRMLIMAHLHVEIGGLCWYRSNYVQQLKHYLKAQKIFEEIDDKRGLALVNLNISAFYLAQDDTDRGLKYLLIARKLAEEINDKSLMTTIYSNIGGAYGQQNKWDEALQNSLKSLAVAKEIGQKLGIALAERGIAQCYEKKGAHREALEHLSVILESQEEIGNKHLLVAAYNLSGCINTRLKNFDLASHHFDRGLQIATDIGDKRTQIENYQGRSELHVAQQNFEQALASYKKSTDLEKVTMNEEKNRQIAEMRTKYETEKKEKEAEIYHLKNVKLRKEMQERKRIEKELMKHRDQLEELVAERTAQLRSLAHELSLVEEKQRRQTANYLHDNIGQALSLAIFKIRSLQESDPAKNVENELSEIKEIIAQTNQRTRSLTFEISPPVLYELGLEPAVEWLAGQFEKQHGIVCSFKDDGLSKPLKDEARVLLFQAVRELLTNVSKHARARAVAVSTVRDGNEIRISVEDDGIGFNPDSLGSKITNNEGFGLFNIKERLHHLGGRFEISSEKGKGTSIVLNAPLKRTPNKTSIKRR